MTGLGLVTPLGVGVSRVWKRLLDGECGIRRIESTDELDYSSLPCQVQSCSVVLYQGQIIVVNICMYNLLYLL